MLISQTEGYFENPYYRFLEEPILFLWALKWNLYEKSFSSIKTKTNSNFSVKLAERSNHSLLLPIWWITFLKHLYSLNVIMECIKLFLEFFIVQTYEKVQKQPSSRFWIELSKTQFFPVSIVNRDKVFPRSSPFWLSVSPAFTWEMPLRVQPYYRKSHCGKWRRPSWHRPTWFGRQCDWSFFQDNNANRLNGSILSQILKIQWKWLRYPTKFKN